MEKAVIDTNVFVNFFLRTDLTERAKDMKARFNRLFTSCLYEHPGRDHFYLN